MTTVRSTRYPSLVVADLDVRFVDGVLRTDDPRVVAACRTMARLGVNVLDDTGPTRAGADDPDAAEQAGTSTSTVTGDAPGAGEGSSTSGAAAPPAPAPPPGNASRVIWEAYAVSRGLQVPASATRDDIMALVAQAS